MLFKSLLYSAHKDTFSRSSSWNAWGKVAMRTSCLEQLTNSVYCWQAQENPIPRTQIAPPCFWLQASPPGPLRLCTNAEGSQITLFCTGGNACTPDGSPPPPKHFHIMLFVLESRGEEAGWWRTPRHGLPIFLNHWASLTLISSISFSSLCSSSSLRWAGRNELMLATNMDLWTLYFLTGTL